jgi:hypothetical protein
VLLVNAAARCAPVADADAAPAGPASRAKAAAETATVITDTHEARLFIGSSTVAPVTS